MNYINRILGAFKGPNNKTYRTIYDIATYPDENQNLTDWANTYHYFNMKGNETKYNESTQCNAPNYCIVKSLQNYTRILQKSTITDFSSFEALSFIVHFMGDFYQPLHAGLISFLCYNFN